MRLCAGVSSDRARGSGGVDAVSSNAANGPQSANLIGLGIEPPIVIAPRSMPFGRVPVGTPVQKSFTITNRNVVAITINSLSSSSTDFQPDTACVGVLSPSASCNAKVVFNPAAGALNRIGVIQIIDNASHSPQSVRVSGIVVQ